MSRALLAISLAFSAAIAAAQEPSVESADIAIIARVRARQLTFQKVPEVRVTFSGTAQTVWKTDRTNLPERVEPHVTYRDIGILLTITSTLPNIEQILDEALGPQKGDSHEQDGAPRGAAAGGAAPGSAAAATATATATATPDDDVD